MTAIPIDLVNANWKVEASGKAISKSFKFKNFRDAMAWMLRVGFEAEKMDHHPEWTNVYNRVSVRLTTHDSDGLTEKDIELAKRIEKVS